MASGKKIIFFIGLLFLYIFFLGFFSVILPESDLMILAVVGFLLIVYVFIFRIYNIYNHLDERRVFMIFMVFCLLIFFSSVVLSLSSRLSGTLIKSPIKLVSLNARLWLTSPYYNETTTISTSVPEHGVYRFWNASIYYKDSLDKPGLYVIGHESSYPFFIKTADGQVIMTIDDPEIRSLIETYVPDNSVGIYTTDGKLGPGSYTFTTNYHFYAPLRCDDKDCLLNFWVYGGYVKHFNLTIYGQVEKIKTSPGLSVKKANGKVFVIGNDVLGPQILVLFKKPSSPGFYIENTNNALALYDKMAKDFGPGPIYIGTMVLLALFFVFLILTYLVYQKYGTEDVGVVPDHLSYVPDKTKKPWEVNYYYLNDGKSTDVNGFLATLLDLKNKGKIDFKKIEESGLIGKLRHKKRLIIKIIDPDTKDLDNYERMVLEFLSTHAKGNEVDIKALCRRAKIDQVLRSRLHDIVFYRPFASSPLDKKGYYLIIAISVVFVGLGFLIYRYFTTTYHRVFAMAPPMLGLIIGMVGLGLCNVLSPVELFSRWRDHEYENKLKWMAFRKFLEDMAMLKKYDENAISQWKEWLVYGVALGVGSKVLKNIRGVLEELKLPEGDLDDLEMAMDFYYVASSSVLDSFTPTVDTGEVLGMANDIISGGNFGGVGGGFGGGGVGGF